MPKFPLACDFYGLFLPKEDSQWNDLVNQFIDQDLCIKKYFPPEIYEKLPEYVH